MLTKDKRSPAFEDTDKMPFGKHEGKPLSDVPAYYLMWLYKEMLPNYKNFELTTHTSTVQGMTTEETLKRVKLFNYMWNSMDALNEETKENIDE